MENNLELIKKRRQYFNALSNRVLFIPFLVFSVLVLIILSELPTPFEERLYAFSAWLLTWLEPARLWVNSSVVYREKMAVVYVLYVLTAMYTLIATSLGLWKNRNFFTVDFIPPIRIDCKNILPILLALVLFVLFIYLAAFSSLFQGSSIWLNSLDQTDQREGIAWLSSIEAMWNIKWTFLLTRWVQLIVIWSCVIGCLQYLSALKICLNRGR